MKQTAGGLFVPEEKKVDDADVQRELLRRASICWNVASTVTSALPVSDVKPQVIARITSTLLTQWAFVAKELAAAK